MSDSGRLSGSREPNPSGLGPSGFDPERNAIVEASTVCAACQARGKTWEGSDPTCAFRNGQPFRSDNWNYATANMIRDLMPRWEEPVSDLVSGPHWMEDQYWGAITIPDSMELLSGDALTLWVSWYKSRGRTDAMWLLSDGYDPRLPTEDDLIAISAHFAIAMEARSGETEELDPKDDSAGRNGIAQ